MFNYFAIYKPFGTLSQFTSEGAHKTLKDLMFDFPKDVYPVGRLDTDSEGLLLLTNDKRVNHKLLNPSFKHERTYLIQVEGDVSEEALAALQGGIRLNINGKSHDSLPAKAIKIDAPELPERNPPVRFRKNIPTSWIALDLIEGKNHQVRKMTASTGFPTLRLVRTKIGDLELKELKSGAVEELTRNDFYRRLKI